MSKCAFLLMLALLLLLSRGGESLPAPAAHSDTTLSGESRGAHTGTDVKRSLRGLKTTDDEERDISQLLGKVKTWAAKLKPKQNIQPWGELTAKERAKMIKAVAERKGTSYKELYRENVTPDEYFKAMRFDYRFRFARKNEIATASWYNPGFKKWDGYEKFYYKQLAKQAKAQAK